MPSMIQPSFSSGELSPSLFARVDTSMYAIGLRTAYNAIIHPYGGVSNRPGSLFLGPVPNHLKTYRMIPFVAGTSDQYILLFGDQTMNIIRDDAYVTITDNTYTNWPVITDVSSANPAQVTTSTAHGFSDGDMVLFKGVAGAARLNDQYYTISDVTSTTFTLRNQVTGDNIDGADLGTYTSGGYVDAVYQLATPWVEADLMDLNYTQSADTMTLVHPSYAPRDLVRTSVRSWAISILDFTSTQAAPTAVTTNFSVGTSNTDRYAVTATGSDESFPGTSSTTSTPESATAANPVVVTDTSHGWANGDIIRITGFNEMTELNGRRFTVVYIDANSYSLRDEDGTGYTAESTGGTATGCFIEIGEKAITGISQASPGVVTTSEAHGFSNGDVVFITGVYGMTEVANRYFAVANVAATTFQLTDPDTGANIATTAYTAYSSGGNVRQTSISWTAASDADFYSVYKEENGLFGWIGDTTDTYFEDRNISPDLTLTMPVQYNPFPSPDNYPRAVAYYEQRLCFAGTNNYPDTMWMSQVGNRKNFASKIPATADDAIEVTLAANEVNVIEHLLPGSDLVVFTSGSEWRVNDGESQTGLSASTIRLKPQSYWGSSELRPIRVNNEMLFAEESKARTRAMAYDYVSDSLKGTDLNLLTAHLFADESPNEYILTDWAWANFPEPRLHCVRSDGLIATMTYEPEQKVMGWTRWETDGTYERVCTLRRAVNSVEDGIYTVVKRTINGSTVRYIERMATRKFADSRLGHFLDSARKIDGRIQVSSITTDANGNTVVTTLSPHGFAVSESIQASDITLANDANGIPQEDACADRKFEVTEVKDAYSFTISSDGAGTVTEALGVPRQQAMGAVTDVWTIGSGAPQGWFIQPTGYKGWYADSSDEAIYEFEMTTPWDVSTASLNGNSWDASGQGINTMGVWMNDDGTKMFVAWNDINACVYKEYALSTAYDLTAAAAWGSETASKTFVIASHSDWAWHPDGLGFDVCYGPSAGFYPITMSTAWDLSTASLGTYYGYQSDVGNTVAVDGVESIQWNHVDGHYMLLSHGGNTPSTDSDGGNNLIEFYWPEAYDVNSGTPIITWAADQTPGDGVDAASDQIGYRGWGADVGYLDSIGTDLHGVIGSDQDDQLFKQSGGSAPAVYTYTPSLDCIPDVSKFAPCVTIVRALDHLEGETGYFLLDGRVATGTIADGAFTVPDGYGDCVGIIYAGLPFCCDIETLNIEAPQGTIQSKLKKITNVLLRFYKSRLPQVGPDRANLVTMKQRSDEQYGDYPTLLSGDRVINILPQWNSNGRLLIRQCEPVPLTVLAVVPDVEISEKTSSGVVQQSNTGFRRA